jgi:pilus assembly protein CpaB
MQMRTILISAFALVFALCAALGAYMIAGTPTQSPDSVPILVLKDNVLSGASLTPEVLETRQVPKDSVPAGAIQQPVDAVGRIVIIPMVKGDPLLDSKLAQKGTIVRLPIEKGYRAFTIQVANASAGVGGFILPGSFVDVMWMSNDATSNTAAKTLQQKVKVLAVDQFIDVPKESAIKEMRSATLQVEPEAAEQLAWAQARGTLSLSLRNVEDKETVVSKDDMVEVVVARENLSRGKTLTVDHLELDKRPKQLVPADAFFDPADAANRVMDVALFKGELLVQSKLMPVQQVAQLDQGAQGGPAGGPQAPPPNPIIHLIRGQNRGYVVLSPRNGPLVPPAK